jgi:phosphoglycolate phosphatase-like HAD superfamily hydrolase
VSKHSPPPWTWVVESDADRTLRDVAPELLAACVAALELLQDPDADAFDADKVEQNLRDVIAKAKGGGL